MSESQRSGQLLSHYKNAQLRGHQQGRVCPWVSHLPSMVLGEPVLAEPDHLVEHRVGRRRAVDHGACEVLEQDQHRRLDSRHETWAGDLAFQKSLLLETHDLTQGVGVARGAKVVFGPEVVSDEPTRHTGGSGDLSDRCAFDAPLRKEANRGVPYSAPGR